MAYQKLRILQDRFEADLVAAALAEAGVDFFIRTFEDTAYDGLFVTQEGWGAVWVAGPDVPEALDILRHFDSLYCSETAGGPAAAGSLESGGAPDIPAICEED